jgi:putative transposase
MPRTARAVLPDCPLHVVQRGINRQPCFFSDADYRIYLRHLAEYSHEFGCSVHAYCLMTNHVHLLLTPHSHDACARMMKMVSQCYVQGVNDRLDRTGTLWEGRFFSGLVTSERYLLMCYRYVERNPVAAGMVTTAEDYPWSSHRTNIGMSRDDFITAHAAFISVGRDAYKELCKEDVPVDVLQEIRTATRLGHAIGAVRRKPGRPAKAPK